MNISLPILKYQRNTCLLLLASMCFFVVTSCKFKPNIQQKGTPALQGIWKQEYVMHQKDLLKYTLYEFKFSCDSVYVTIDTYNKSKTITDHCFHAGHWQEYAQGIYIIREDSLLIESVFTRKDGRQKMSGCYRQGAYLPHFKIMKSAADSIFLAAQYTDAKINMRKIQTITCVPKPLN